MTEKDGQREVGKPGRRSDDPLKKLTRAYHDLAEETSERFARWLKRATVGFGLVVLGFSAFAYYVVQDIKRAGEDRRAAVTTLCAATSAVIDAGRTTITNGGQLPPRLERNLIRLGYPQPDVRRRQAQDAARLYGESIALRVQRATKAEGIVTVTGRLRCAALADSVDDD